MFLAAWTSRCSAKPQQQTCWRCRKHFSTTWPQLLHRWLVPRAFTSTTTTPALSALHRGGDVILVQRAIDVYAVKAVRYAPQALVQHIEDHGPWVWVQKMFIYGRATRKYRPIVRRSGCITATERLQVFRQTIARYGYSRANRTTLLFLQALGVGAHLDGPSNPEPRGGLATFGPE